jgi:hypothetical protein
MGEVDLISGITGLSNHQGDINSPNGALAVADNVVQLREGVIERRPGFANFSTGLPDAMPEQMFVSAGILYLHLGNYLWYYDEANSRWARKVGLSNMLLQYPWGIWCDDDAMYVVDAYHLCVWKMDRNTGVTSLFAGLPGVGGSADGTGTAARFDAPQGCWADATYLYVCDTNNHTIRKIARTTGAVTTLAGTAGASGTTDATGSSARFHDPKGIWGDGNGNLYVTDYTNNSVRKIVASSGVVTTFAGLTGTSGDLDGTGTAARLHFPYGIGGHAASGYIWVGTLGGTARLKRIAISTGAVTTLFSSGGQVSGIAANSTHVYFTLRDLCLVKRCTHAGGTVTTLVGQSSTIGATDGFATSALLADPLALALSGTSLYITDSAKTGAGYTVREYFTDTTQVTTIMGTPGLSGARTGIATSVFGGPDDRRVRSAEYNGNLFITSERGIRKSESAAARYSMAGLPRGLDLTLALTGASGFLANNKATSYRLLWGIRDTNDNLEISAPSSRFTITNAAGGSRNTTINFKIPAEITTAHFFQIYRTYQVDSGVDPGDELFLAYEANPSETQLAAGEITVTDITTDDFINTELYTNATWEGIIQSNDRPPKATDITLYRDSLFFANTTQPHRKTINLVGVSGFVSGTSTITIAGITYTCNSGAEDASIGQFQYFTGGTVATDVENTARSLVKIINRYTGNGAVYAYYASTEDGVPGQILLEERGVGGDSFSATCHSSISAMFAPIIPTSGTAYASTNDRAYNRLYFSKNGQPSHVPTANYVNVGPKNEEIQRIVALRDSVIIIKDSSVWRLTGDSPSNFSVALLDNTVALKARDSAAVLNNEVYCLTNQGVVAISDNGVRIVSRPEEYKILGCAPGEPNHADVVGVGHEQLRCYVMSVPTSDFVNGGNGGFGQDYPNQVAYVYNVITNSWSRWFINANCFSVFDDRLYYGLKNTYGHVLRQRLRDDSDYAIQANSDESGSFFIGSINTTTNVVTGTFEAGVNYDGYNENSTIGYGWSLWHNNQKYLVLSYNGSNAITLDRTSGLNSAEGLSKSVYRPIKSVIEFTARHSNRPCELKQYEEIVAVCETQDCYKLTFEFANESNYKTDPLAYDYWNDTPSVDVTLSDLDTSESYTPRFYPSRRIRTLVPPAKAISSQLSVRIENSVADSHFAVKALGINTRLTGSTKVTR